LLQLHGLTTAGKYNPPALPTASTYRPRKSSEDFSPCPDDDRRYPCGEQSSELQRDDRIAAECASHLLSHNKLSLLC